jgi:hypothetical protein
MIEDFRIRDTVLELDRIATRLRAGVDQRKCLVWITVMIRADLADHQAAVTDRLAADRE